MEIEKLRKRLSFTTKALEYKMTIQEAKSLLEEVDGLLKQISDLRIENINLKTAAPSEIKGPTSVHVDGGTF